MSFLTRFGLVNSRLTILTMILIVIVGWTSYVNFSKREDPAITVRTAIVTAANFGLSVEQLEELVALPLEETARAIPGVSEVRTQITSGATVLQVDLADEVPEENLKRVFDEIRDDVNAIRGDLPEGTIGPNVNSDFGDVSIATIALTGDGFSLPEVEDAAKDLRDRMYALDAVASVDLYGEQQEVITLQVDRSRLASIGVTINPILAAIQGQNVRLPAGSVLVGDTRIPLETSGDLKSVEEIEVLLIELPNVGIIRLGDLVTVKRELEQPAATPVYHSGKPAIILAVEMADGEDITDVGTLLKDVVETFAAEQPLGLNVEFSTFQPTIVSASVNGALINMGQTFLVVFVVMLFFLGWREALVVSTIVPFAVSFAFGMMGPFGVVLQQVSIAAIIISLGLLVDNGVVIIEDMQRRIAEGAERFDAAIASGEQYFIPLGIASITTVAAFIPLFLLIGTEGEYGYSLGVVVMLMLVGSFLSALYLLPRLAVWALPTPDKTGKEGIFDKLSNGYERLVQIALKAPLIVVALVIGIIALGGWRMSAVPQQLFPLSERAQILAYIDLPKGTDIAATRETALKLSNWLEGTDNPEVTSATTYVGAGGPRFVLSLDPADVDPASAFMVINTQTFEESALVIDRARSFVAEELPEAYVRLKRIAMGGREPVLDIEISGPDGDKLLQAANTIQASLSTAPGIVENRNDWGAKQLNGTVQIAQDRIREYNLTSRDVSEALDGFFDGRQVSTLREGDDLIPIELRGAPEDRKDYEALANAAIDVEDQILSIDQFATLEPHLEFSTLRRVDQRRTITVSAISETATTNDLLAHVQNDLDELRDELGPAYMINLAGEIENSAEVRGKLGAGFPIAIGVMLMALMVQFNSFRRVAITALSVPLVIAAVPFALLLAGQPLSFFGILGLIALSGIIINNAIVMIDQIDIERETSGLDDAISTAAQKRFRPIMLASLTTVIGLSPMAFAGGALWEPMATLMMGGLAGGALLALFWVPALYKLLFKENEAKAS